MSKDTPDLSLPKDAAPASTPPAPTPPVTAEEDTVVAEIVLEPAEPSVLARLGGEALGTFFLVLVGLGIALYTTLSNAGSLGVALGFGLALTAGTIAFGHLSGGHFNPAVTLGSAIAGRTAWSDVLPYWLAQIVGGALATAALFLTIPAKLPALVKAGDTARTFFATTANGFGKHSPLATLSQGQIEFELLPALLIEIVATALLVAVVLAVTNRPAQRSLAPFAIGFTYAVLVLVASPITGGSLNPARSTAAALFSGSAAFSQLWLFWVAPLIGAALAGLAHRAFAADPIEDTLFEDTLFEDEEILVTDTRA